MASGRKKTSNPDAMVIENRRARHDYVIGETLECGLRLLGTEVKSIRAGQASLAEGWIRATTDPPSLVLQGVHVGEYPPAGPHRQHQPVRPRVLLAHKREILKLARSQDGENSTLVPLKIYFVDGRAKVLIGVAQGRKKSDKRQDIAKREAQRDMDRAMRRRG
ncbi:MAG: SsrA-binding protein SmpB [Phycisphaerales bacterium]|jgi:SsrA-binding protein|nr:SsrA-binding protein SmpB [Phycisphaerales bacterium]